VDPANTVRFVRMKVAKVGVGALVVAVVHVVAVADLERGAQSRQL
jgi:hypothetical protein